NRCPLVVQRPVATGRRERLPTARFVHFNESCGHGRRSRPGRTEGKPPAFKGSQSRRRKDRCCTPKALTRGAVHSVSNCAAALLISRWVWGRSFRRLSPTAVSCAAPSQRPTPVAGLCG